MNSRRTFLNQSLVFSSAVGAGNLLSHPTVAQGSSTTNNPILRFAHMTDVHVYAGRSSAKGLAQALHHIQAQENPPDFILTGGDAVYDTLKTKLSTTLEQWNLWNSVLKSECSLPFYHCLGNHDVWGWDQKESQTTGKEPKWGKQIALEHYPMKDRYYSFDQACWRFIILDSIHTDPQNIYRGELDEKQFQWLSDQLQNTPPAMPVIVVSHIPILTASDYVFRQSLTDAPYRRVGLVHQDNIRILKLFEQHANIKLCLSGHTHTTEAIQMNHLALVNSGAICGQWWKGPLYHTKEGYSLIDLYSDGRFEQSYIHYNWQAT